MASVLAAQAFVTFLLCLFQAHLRQIELPAQCRLGRCIPQDDQGAPRLVSGIARARPTLAVRSLIEITLYAALPQNKYGRSGLIPLYDCCSKVFMRLSL